MRTLDELQKAILEVDADTVIVNREDWQTLAGIVPLSQLREDHVGYYLLWGSPKGPVKVRFGGEFHANGRAEL